MRHPRFFFRVAEPLRLQVEHRAVPAVLRHQFIVRSELDDFPVLEHADPIREAHG